MIPRIGIDLIAVDVVSTSLREHAERYLARVFTPEEVERAAGPGGPSPRRLARSVAAKEATMKVLAPTPDDALPWRSVELVEAPGAPPRVDLHGRAAARAARLGLASLDVTVADAGGMASAVVTGLPAPPPQEPPR